MAEKDKKTKIQRGGDNDVYTALLGLTVLVLGATTAIVCIFGQQMWGSVFSIT